MNSENETCEGCVHSVPDSEYLYCHREINEGPCRASTTSCPEFAPNLECRAVRAMEKIAGLLATGPTIIGPECKP